MTKQFDASFVRDLLRATQYLHESCQLTHGALNTQSCMISVYWSLKLSDYGLNTVLDDMVLTDALSVHDTSVDGKLLVSNCAKFTHQN
jgi:serine/threonine protein kinase